MKTVQFKNAKLEMLFASELKNANGKLNAGALYQNEIDAAFAAAVNEFKLLKKDFDTDLKITVNPTMAKVPNSYKYSRQCVRVTFEFKKSKIVNFKFDRRDVGVNGISTTFKLEITPSQKQILIGRIFENVRTFEH